MPTDKLLDILSGEQKKIKIGNLLTRLRRAGLIINCGTTSKSYWKLKESGLYQKGLIKRKI